MRSIAEKYSLTPGVGVVVFDPVSMTALAATAVAALPSMSTLAAGATIAGGAASAAGALAAGSAANSAGQMKQAGYDFEAKQLDQNAAGELAASQRRMLDTQDKTRLAIASSTARAGASGVNAGVGSPAGNVGALAQRGSYHAAMDLFQGESNAGGLLNRAAGATYSGDLAEIGGEEAKSASYLAAGGDVASTVGRLKYG